MRGYSAAANVHLSGKPGGANSSPNFRWCTRFDKVLRKCTQFNKVYGAGAHSSPNY